MNYSTEVTQRLSKIFLALLDLLGSKKFLAAAGAGLTGWYQTGDARMLVGSILTFVLAQGVADHGKEKAFVDMATAAMSGRTAPKEELVFRPAPPLDDLAIFNGQVDNPVAFPHVHIRLKEKHVNRLDLKATSFKGELFLFDHVPARLAGEPVQITYNFLTGAALILGGPLD